VPPSNIHKTLTCLHGNPVPARKTLLLRSSGPAPASNSDGDIKSKSDSTIEENNNGDIKSKSESRSKGNSDGDIKSKRASKISE